MNICVDPLLQSHLKAKGVDAVVFDEVLTHAEKQRMLEKLYDFVNGWFLSEAGQDFTLYRDVSLGGGVRDEMMQLFHLVLHFSTLLAKCEGSAVKVYQSSSCLLPEIVERVIADCGAEIVTEEANYPYVCFRQAWHRNAQGNYSCVNFDEAPPFLPVSNRSISERVMAALISGLKKWWGRKGFHYALVIRNLIPLYAGHLQEGGKSGLLLADYSKLLPGVGLLEGMGPWKTLLALACKGVFVGPLKAPPDGIDTIVAEEETKAIVAGFDENFSQSAADFFIDIPEGYSQLFTRVFAGFFKDSICKIARQVDRLYDIFSSPEIRGSVMEMAHPLLVQVASNMNKKTYVVASNILLHNQYFNEYLAKRCGEHLVMLAYSEYDASRYTRLGVPRDNIRIDANLYSMDRPTVRKFLPTATLQGATVLVIPCFAPSLYTFRLQVVGRKVLSYLDDVFDVLNKVGVSRVLVRHHPGMEGYVMNETGHTFKDFNEYVFDKSIGQYDFEVEMQDSEYTNLAETMEGCDLVVGTMSGTIVDAMQFGKNYIVYDNTISPYPAATACSLVYDGYIETCETKAELEAAVADIRNLDRDKIFEDCYPFLMGNKDSDFDLAEVLR